MKRYMQKSVSALAMSALVMGGVTISAVSFSAVPAFSKGGNSGNGNGNGRGNGKGAIASSLGALNAAHANENAFANASPNSRVGLIALYKSAVEASAEAEGAITEAQEAYDLFAETFETSFETVEDYDAAVLAAAEGGELPSEEEVAYWEELKILQTAIDDATLDAEAVVELEEAALEAAANKETSEEVIDALWDLLGLPAEEEEPVEE